MLFYVYYDECELDIEALECGNVKCKYSEFKKVKGIRVDRRTVSSPDDLTYHPNAKEKWYQHGVNHRVEDEHICRDFETEFYIIEINTIDDILNFQLKYNINASISPWKSGYVFNGEELKSFNYYME